MKGEFLPVNSVDLELGSDGCAQVRVTEADVHRVGVIAQVDALLQVGQFFLDAQRQTYLMATFEVEVGPATHVDGEGGAAEGGVNAAALVVEVLTTERDVTIEERPNLSIAFFVERVTEVDVQSVVVLLEMAIKAVAAIHHLLIFGPPCCPRGGFITL